MPALDELTPTPSTVASPAQALDTVREELLAIHPRDLLPINLDVAAGALIVLGAASEIREHRPALVALCGEEMASAVDRLELVARAALQAQAMHRSVESGAEVNALSVEVVKHRDVLLAEVRSLIARGVLSPGSIRELNGINGFKNQCLDVLQLVSILEEQWEVIATQTGLTRAHVHRAEAAASALATAVGMRDQASRSPVADVRQRAYTLMAKTYDKVRRMMTFLRWEQGDAERIAPSIFRGRGNGRRRKDITGSDHAREPAVQELLVQEPDGVMGPRPVVSPDLPGAPPFPT